jgi:hypothetical protein
MSGGQEVTYAFDFRPAKSQPLLVGDSIPRIARLMALAIRFQGLLREKKIRDYVELARLGRVTRARMTQIMKLLDLAPDIQEQILFLPPPSWASTREISGRLSAGSTGTSSAACFRSSSTLRNRARDSRLSS